MDKIDRLIQTVRTLKEEGGMVVGTGGFSAAADPEGPVAGNTYPMEVPKKRKKIIGLGPGSRKRWMDSKS